jgi:hypothetical protein
MLNRNNRTSLMTELAHYHVEAPCILRTALHENNGISHFP